MGYLKAATSQIPRTGSQQKGKPEYTIGTFRLQVGELGNRPSWDGHSLSSPSSLTGKAGLPPILQVYPPCNCGCSE